MRHFACWLGALLFYCRAALAILGIEWRIFPGSAPSGADSYILCAYAAAVPSAAALLLFLPSAGELQTHPKRWRGSFLPRLYAPPNWPR